MWQLSRTDVAQTTQRDIVAEADSLLFTAPYSVAYKDVLPPSGDKHDYISMGPYWWADPTKEDHNEVPSLFFIPLFVSIYQS